MNADSCNKQSIRTAEDGLISFQFMVPLSARAKAGDGKEGFVEFLVSYLVVPGPRFSGLLLTSLFSSI